MQDCKKLDTEMVVVNNDNHYFRGKTTTVVHPGWKVMYRYLAHRDESDGEDQSSGDAFDDDRLLNETYDEVEQDPDIDAQLFSTYLVCLHISERSLNYKHPGNSLFSTTSSR